MASSPGVPAAAAGRRRRGRPPLDRDRMIATALDIVDQGGADALSMRTLARRLGSSTATLYRHFPHRNALIVAVMDRVVGEIDADPEEFRTLGWREGCEKICRDIFKAFQRHPWSAILLADHVPTGPNAAAVRERLLAVLMAGGFDAHLAARTGAMLGHMIQGFAIQLSGERNISDEDRQTFGKALKALDLSLFPATAAAQKARFRPTSVEEEFSFALEMVLDGISLLRSEN